MNKKEIIGLNTSFKSLGFDGFHENSFSGTVSLLDYDAVVIDVGFLAETRYGKTACTYQNKVRLSDYESSQIVDDFTAVREQLIELLKQGRNVFLLMGRNENCYVFTGEKQYSGTGKNARQTNIIREFDMYSFLPVQIKATHVYGNKMTLNHYDPFYAFLKETADLVQYSSYFSVNRDCIPLATISGTEKMVAAAIPFEKGSIICLPQPYYEDEYVNEEDWPICGRRYLECLFALNESLSMSKEETPIPEWVNGISILDEQQAIGRKKEVERQIEELQIELAQQEQLIKSIQRYKLLMSATGNSLEELVKQVLSELGFTLTETEKGRSDIVAQYNGIDVVAEIKGVSKSAAEKHAAQLEKWVSLFVEENERIPKAVLFVNGFLGIPVKERTEDVFPHQMLKYCEARGHALVTTTQLLCLYIEIRENPECKEDRLNEMLSCVGKYQRYQDIDRYLISCDREE